MVSSVSQAVSAYANAAAKLNSPGMEARDQPGGSFGDMMSGMLDNALSTAKAGEQASAQAVAGKADINEVVMAVNNAELSLQTIVGIRDKIIGAYQEILRMPI